MPVISQFYGIIIRMYFNDDEQHHTPHFHAKFATHPFYKPLSSESIFQSISVRDGEIEWATGQDFCPHTLYEKSVPVESHNA